ncbi:MAG: hypothetical protein IKD40_02875 [Bacteroidaceae bacterium]|nr:hypothetical protein [Bacteroidaceae bacterium]
MPNIHIKLTISEWDIGGKDNTTSYLLDKEITEVGEKLIVNKAFPNRYTFTVESITDTEICLSCNCPPMYLHLKKGEKYNTEYNIEGYEDHDGCVWNGEDEFLSIEWL